MGKLTGRTLMILGLSFLSLLVGRPGSAFCANLYYGPWLIPADKNPTRMIIMIMTSKGVDNDFNHRRIHFTYDSSCPEPNWSYSYTDIVVKLAEDRRLWRIDVSNLKPQAKYGYSFKYRDWSGSPWSSVSGSFWSTQDASPDNEVLEFIGVGDNKAASEQAIEDGETVADGIGYFGKGSFLVHTGDFAFNGGNKLSDDTTDYWGRFLGDRNWWEVVRYLPMLAALGNHDFDVDNHAGQSPTHANMTNYLNYFPYPNAGLYAQDAYYYNVNGPAWFLSIDTFPMWGSYCGECDNLKPESAQYRWLEATLNQIDNDSRQWKIVLMHAPMYSPGDCNQYEAREYLEPLFEEHGVDLVLTGHEHYYCRKTVPTTAPFARNASTTHALLGGGGAGISAWHADQEKYFDKVVGKHHYAHFKIDKDVMEVTVIHPYWTGFVFELIQETIDHFYVDRTPQAHFGYQSLAGGSLSPQALGPNEKAPPPGSIRVLFQDQSKGHRYQYLWDFGDDTTSPERNPTHYYAKPGIYNVTLTIKSMWNQSSITGQVAATLTYPQLNLLLVD